MKKQLIDILKKNKFKLIIEFIVLILFTYFKACPAKYLGNVIDLLYDIQQNEHAIMQNVIFMVLTTLGIVIARKIYKYIDFNLELYMQKKLRENLFEKLMKMRLEDIKSIKNGEIMSYFVVDIKKVSRFLLRSYSAILRASANIIIVLVLMIESSNVKLAVSAMIPIFLSIIILVIIRKKIRKDYKKARQAFTQFSEFVQENTDSIRTVKAFSGERIEEENFKEKNYELKKNNLKVSYNKGLSDVIINIGIGISYTIAIAWGADLVFKEIMTVGNVVAFIGYLTLLDLPMRFIPWVISRYDELKVSIARLDKMFKLPEEKIKVEENLTETIGGNIEIKDLSYHYPDSLDKVLSNITVDVKKGETLGIIGVIGSGKTTLMNLLLKLYFVPRGKISIGGKDINDIPTEVLRNSICYITQESFLFSSTLKENINLFKDTYKDEEIEESTEKAMIYDEIQKMEEGINTIIGEKGIDLSGGQKQRVVISRAFLNNSNIIIFDDTFSALDNKTEQSVLENIKELVKDKTCIIISNRISDIKDCDKIIVMEQGKIIEQGNHNTLLDKNGKYYEFYKGQANKIEVLE